MSIKQSDKLLDIYSKYQAITQFTESLSLKLEAQQTYAKSLNKFSQKLNKIQFNLPQTQWDYFQLLIKRMQYIASQKIHQVCHYKQQIKEQNDFFIEKFKQQDTKIKQKFASIKNYEKQLKVNNDKLVKNKEKTEQYLKESDQKFIQMQLALLNPSMKIKNDNCQLIVNEQQKVRLAYDDDLKKYFESIKNVDKSIEKQVQESFNILNNIQFEFTDFIKKIMIQEVSVIRNFQYQIDGFIKKTQIFKDQEINSSNKTEASNNQINKLSRYHLITKQNDEKKYNDYSLNQSHNYKKLKENIIKNLIKKEQTNQDLSKDQYADIFENKQTFSRICEDIKQYQKKKNAILAFIESYRKKNQFKFLDTEFYQLLIIFEKFLQQAHNNEDMSIIKSIFLYGSSYYYIHNEKKKICILDVLKCDSFLSNQNFWRFFLLQVIKQSLQQHPMKENAQMHMINIVYSTLISNSLQMIGCGIEKYDVKNIIAKTAKGYGLNEVQISQLLKFVQNGYENYQKNQIKQKTMKKIMKLKAKYANNQL